MVKRRKTRKRNSRKKKGGSVCRTFNNNCNDCVTNNNPRCTFNSSSKNCSKQTLRKKQNRSWSRTCGIDDLPLATAANMVVTPLRQESEGGTTFVNAETVENTRLRPGFIYGLVPDEWVQPVPYGTYQDEIDDLHGQRRMIEQSEAEVELRLSNLKRDNGIVNDNSVMSGAPCFTPCEHKGWCESGIKGACDLENYCYPSNGTGTWRDIDEKEYCDKPTNRGGRRKSRRRKSRRRKSRGGKKRRKKSKTRKRKSRKQKRKKRPRRKSQNSLSLHY